MFCSVARVGVRFGTVYLMYVNFILGSVMVAERPPFGKELLPWLTICSLCIKSFVVLVISLFRFGQQ